MRTPRALVLLLLAACPNGGSNDGGDDPDAGMRCITPSDCPQPGACESVACTFGRCRRSFSGAGSSAGGQMPGDCKRRVCDGSGGVNVVNDDTDRPADISTDCQVPGCSMGAPTSTALDAGVRCGTMGLCDTGGLCVGCRTAADCGPATECRTPTCSSSVCGFTFAAQGTAVAAQTAGDCRRVQCNGQGVTETAADDLDLPDDARACTQNRCTAGQPSHPPVQSGTPCAEDGGTLCDSAGLCRECLVALDCPGTDTECRARACVAGACGSVFADAGTAVSGQSAGDCRRSVCNGAGVTVTVSDDADLPNDNNACTANGCDAGSTWFPALDAGVACGATSVCNAAGQCVGCNAPSDCGTNDACKTHTCNGGTCGLSLAMPGTVVSNPVVGDCRRNVCDAQGNIVAGNFDSDVPADDGNGCTDEVCNAGVPGHPILPTNTVCDAGVCNPMGACVQCNAAGQCAGADTSCRARTCVSGACGVALADAGIVTSGQVVGDCKQSRCDGDGGVVVVTFDSDLPLDDGQQCTDEVCSMGVPSHPPRGINTPCSSSGGSYCNAAGGCVQCNSGPQCMSLVCTANVCAQPSCMDLVKNGAETDIDCGGGSCAGCGPSLACMGNGDCSGGACNPNTLVCAPTCNDSQAPGATCSTYCACMTATCGSKFPSMAACITACSQLPESALCCRAYHCTAAMGDAVTHCPHAAGEAVCQ